MSRVAPGETITVLSNCGIPKLRHYLRVDFGAVALNMGVHNNTMANALRAVRERVFAVERNGTLQPPPRPRRGVIESRMAAFRAGLVKAVGHCTPWTYTRFLESYKGSKLLRYTRAVESLRARGVNKLDACLQSFVKAEAVNFTAKPDPAPRIIQPRGVRYNAFIGRFIRPLEHRVYAGIAELYGGPTVMKGYNAEGTAAALRGMWEAFEEPVALSLDASRFDQHVSLDALKWEHSVYNAVYHNNELRSKLMWQLHNVGYVRTSDGAFKYTVDGCRMSGDMNTALGNCLLMCAMVWTYAQTVGVRVRLANNGDDCSVFMERRDLARFTARLDQWFLEMGFTLTSDGVAHVFERVDFCQTRPVWAAGRWVMCRSPHVGCAKDVLCKFPDLSRPVAGYKRWAYQVGMAGARLARGVPVLQESYRSMMRTGSPSACAQGFGNMESGFEHMAAGMSAGPSDVDDAARFSFWRAWGITPDQQVALEQHYRDLDGYDTVRAVKSPADNRGFHQLHDSY